MSTAIANPPHSTEPDVNMLEKKYRDSPVGHLIKYTELENLLHIKRHTPRWMSVIGRWKRILLSRSVVLVTVRGEGYQIADNRQKLDTSTNAIRASVKKIVYAGAVANVTGKEGLTEDQIRTRDHQRRISAHLQAELMLAPKAIE